MPWREICPMDARMKFVSAVRAGEDSMTALCEEYGVSRRVGYKWLARSVAEGPRGLQERLPGPRQVPARTAASAVGDHPSPGRGDSRAVAATSELGAQKAARQVAGTGAGAGTGRR